MHFDGHFQASYFGSGTEDLSGRDGNEISPVGEYTLFIMWNPDHLFCFGI